jgi:benzil reductase ((S)-benzoin forming)
VVGASLVWVTGASSGLGRALTATVPWPGATVVGVSRRPPEADVEHVTADLADPAEWSRVGEVIAASLRRREWERIALLHAAGTIDPVGFAAEVDPDRYRANVLLNAAAPLVLGQLFLRAVRDLSARRHLVLLTSGAARTVYPGWSAYGAAKAAVDQWVRDVGAEQRLRGGVQVLAIAPGTVDTPMQAVLRSVDERDFPQRQKFLDLHAAGRLTPPEEAARAIWRLLDRDVESGSVVDLRELPPTSPG